MFNFSRILTDLQAAIARRAARDRTLTVLLLAVWGRIARMRARLERLVALWRAGVPPLAPVPRAPRTSRAGQLTTIPNYPTAPDWLVRTLGHEAVAVGLQLRHLLTEAECEAFLAAVPQAGRVLRPLLRMLSGDPLPEVVRAVKQVAPVPAPIAEMVSLVASPVAHFLDA
ncbi:MAG: hypothetical protein H7251_11565 [Acetobacteraceae bacterium]|nr:hypothetical protein [Acetobacteraceae bacterium]